jgi:hypothetical protein
VHLVVDKFQYVYDGKLDAGLNNLCITRVLALQYIRISVSFFCDDRPPFELKNVKQLTRDSFLPALIGTRIHQADRWIYYDKATVRRRSSGRISTVLGDEYHVRYRRSWRQRSRVGEN